MMETNTMDTSQDVSASTKSRYEEATKTQIEKIANSKGYGRLFHAPMPNNFSLVLVNKDLDLKRYIGQYAGSLKQLNVVNYNLYRFCELTLDQVAWICEENEKDARLALAKWGNLIKAGNSFLSFQHISYLIKAFQNNGFPVLEVLKSPKYSLIIEKLIGMDTWVKSFFKMSLYHDFRFFYEKFDDFLVGLKNENTLRSAIDKLEIAKEYFPSDKKMPIGRKVTMSVFFNPANVSGPDDQPIRQLSKLISDIFLTGSDGYVDDESDYIQMIQPGICLSQGFKSYKQYLKLLEEIGEVYDVATSYAYIKR